MGKLHSMIYCFLVNQTVKVEQRQMLAQRPPEVILQQAQLQPHKLKQIMTSKHSVVRVPSIRENQGTIFFLENQGILLRVRKSQGILL